MLSWISLTLIKKVCHHNSNSLFYYAIHMKLIGLVPPHFLNDVSYFSDEETHPVDLNSLSNKLLPGLTTLGFKDDRRHKGMALYFHIVVAVVIFFNIFILINNNNCMLLDMFCRTPIQWPSSVVPTTHRACRRTPSTQTCSQMRWTCSTQPMAMTPGYSVLWGKIFMVGCYMVEDWSQPVCL